MEYKLKAGPQGHVYFPKIIRDNLGNELRFLPNSETGVIYSKDADPNRVIESLKIIISDLKLRAKPREPVKPTGKQYSTTKRNLP